MILRKIFELNFLFLFILNSEFKYIKNNLIKKNESISTNVEHK